MQWTQWGRQAQTARQSGEQETPLKEGNFAAQVALGKIGSSGDRGIEPWIAKDRRNCQRIQNEN
jgi:hypothetical protein